MYNLDKLLNWHFFVAFWVFLKDLNQKGTSHQRTYFTDFEIFAEHHKLIDGHDSGLVHNLLKSWVLSSSITNFTVMFEDNFQVVLIFFGYVLKIELIGPICHIFVNLLILFRVIAIRDRLNKRIMTLLLMGISFHFFVLIGRLFMIIIAFVLEI
jgi:hypothetical protein